MAYGAMLGAGAFVCMFVVGLILSKAPAEPLAVNPALVRDVGGYMVILLLLLPTFSHGLTAVHVVAMAGFYVILAGAPPCRCSQRRCRRHRGVVPQHWCHGQRSGCVGGRRVLHGTALIPAAPARAAVQCCTRTSSRASRSVLRGLGSASTPRRCGGT